MRSLIILGACLLSACATTPVSLTQSNLAPLDRVYIKETPTTSTPAKAVFLRDTGLFGSAIYQHLFINGKKAAALKPGERVELSLTPCEYIFGVQPTDFFGTEALYSIDQKLEPNRTYFYRILFEGGESGKARIQRFIPDVGK